LDTRADTQSSADPNVRIFTYATEPAPKEICHECQVTSPLDFLAELEPEAIEAAAAASRLLRA